jgi:hypothetical protein
MRALLWSIKRYTQNRILRRWRLVQLSTRTTASMDMWMPLSLRMITLRTTKAVAAPARRAAARRLF